MAYLVHVEIGAWLPMGYSLRFDTSSLSGTGEITVPIKYDARAVARLFGVSLDLLDPAWAAEGRRIRVAYRQRMVSRRRAKRR